MFIRTQRPLRVPAGALLGLTLKQFDARAHLVKIHYVDEGREQFMVEAREPLVFKAGEELWLESVPKDWAGQVTVLDEGETNSKGPGSLGPVDGDTDSAGGSAGSAEVTAVSSGTDAQDAAGAGEPAPARPGKTKPKAAK
jgi:hypothetical protein